jgi:hypothetical protein
LEPGFTPALGPCSAKFNGKLSAEFRSELNPRPVARFRGKLFPRLRGEVTGEQLPDLNGKFTPRLNGPLLV